ncbi:hypothetical protein ZIOFF_045748 [Zingiber officinale]|uniref:Uncharacterized protein n=1 Tax=Zingiber officinale TaxID=94328 RepID=A0A8J5G3S7_ZINOF|nr:hypothetical protein ZIOFF_045748 [Zingiber officinale]
MLLLPKGKVDFEDTTTTYEFLFKDYWELIKDQEKLTLVDLHPANALLKRGENCQARSYSDGLEEVESYFDEFKDNFNIGLAILEDLKGTSVRSKKWQKRSRPKEKEFVGWGSSFGKDTKEPLTQLDALLESHFASSDNSDDVLSFSSEEGDDAFGAMSTAMALRVSNMHKDVPMYMLTDDDFHEDECEYLCKLANKDSRLRPHDTTATLPLAGKHMASCLPTVAPDRIVAITANIVDLRYSPQLAATVMTTSRIVSCAE